MQTSIAVFWTLLLAICIILTTHASPLAPPSSDGLNNFPIIGILTQPRQYHNPDDLNANKFYLAASYVKFVESSGARVVPIPWNIKRQEARELLSKLNGLLLPGGDSDYEDSVDFLLDAAVEMNQQGIYFPVFGICQGMQQISIYFSKNRFLLQRFRVMNQSLALEFSPEANKTRLYNAMSPDLKILFADTTKNITMNFHDWGVSMDDWANPKYRLSEQFHLIATNHDENDKKHVSVIEHKTLPIFATQYHPEKHAFEFGRVARGSFKSVIPHGLEAIIAQQFTANFFVFETRKNFNEFPTVMEEEANLIYNWAKQKEGGSFVEQYFFYYY